MNENPEGTPNPLNPNPATVARASSSSAGMPSATPTQPVGAMPTTNPAPKPAPTGLSMDFMQPPRQGASRVARPASVASARAQAPTPASPAVGTQPVSGASRPIDVSSPSADDAIAAIMAESTETNPADDLVAKDSIVEPKNGKKSKKKIAIIVGIILLVVALACGIAAGVILLLNSNNGRVDAAITKWLEGEEPTNIEANGTILITDDSDTATFSSLLINLDTKNDRVSSSNTTSANIKMTLPSEQELSFNVDGIQVNGGDLFLKLSNMDATGGEQALLNTESEPTNCITDESGETNCAMPADDAMLVEEPPVEDCIAEDGTDTCAVVEPAPIASDNSVAMLMGLFETVDGQWIRIPLGEANTEEDLEITENSLSCINTTLSALSQNRNSIVELYRQNSFIKSSTDNIKIVAKTENPIYQITFDSEKMAGFSSALSNTNYADELFACTDELNAGAELDDIFTGSPTVYVEVDDNNDFTRLYLDGSLANTNTSMTVDLVLTYPSTIQATEPSDYIDLTTLLTNLVTSFYGDTITTDDGSEETVIIEDDAVYDGEVLEEEYMEEITE